MMRLEWIGVERLHVRLSKIVRRLMVERNDRHGPEQGALGGCEFGGTLTWINAGVRFLQQRDVTRVGPPAGRFRDEHRGEKRERIAKVGNPDVVRNARRKCRFASFNTPTVNSLTWTPMSIWRFCFHCC